MTTLYWQPSEPQIIRTSIPDEVIENLERSFGKMPIILDIYAVDQLATMAEEYSYVSNNPYQQLIDHLLQYPRILVF